MKNNYNDCLTRLLKDEGGYSNDPNDAGGPTNFGITLKDYCLYINKAGTADDVKHMTIDQAKKIYKSKYWDALACDSLSSGVDYTCFDYGVNSGLGRPRKALDAFKSLSGTKLITAINNERTTFLQGLARRKPQNQKFLNGWLNRVSRVNAHSLELAKKDNVSGPIAGTVTGGVVAASSFSSIFAQHPYLTVGLGIGLALGIGLIVHLILNKGK
jgi:lysozyme family protein